MATRSPARNLDGQGRPTSGLDDRGEREAIKRYRGPGAEYWEERARETARRFGVDENISPRDRAMAVSRVVKALGGIGAGYRAARASPQTVDREPGSDDE